MTMVDRTTMTETVNIFPVDPTLNRSRREICCGLTSRDLLKLTAHSLIPLSLGLFTVIITVYQHQVSMSQRLKDRQEAWYLRNQDLNISAGQREQDLNNAALQREQDRNISALQRDLDKELALQRREDDDLNAQLMRNMSRDQHLHEMTLEKKRYIDSVLLSYMNEMGELLEKYNGTLSPSTAIAALARAKTLHVFRIIGAQQSLEVIQFLRDAQQLHPDTNNIPLDHKEKYTPLDLTGARLEGMDLSKESAGSYAVTGTSLQGVRMGRTSFIGQDLSYSDFTDAQLEDADFSQTVLLYTNFARANLTRANFTRALCEKTIFNESVARNASFSRARIDKATFRGAYLEGSTFREAHITQVSFDRTNLEEVNFVVGTLSVTQFRKARLSRSLFVGTTLRGAQFQYCDLQRANFSFAHLDAAKFFGSDLAFAVLVNASLPYASFTYANLSHANMLGSDCSVDCGLTDAISLDSTVLPNGTIGLPPPPLFYATYADFCDGKDTLTAKGWAVQHPKIPLIFEINGTKCLFLLPSNISWQAQRLNQQIDLTKYRKFDLHENDTAPLDLHLLVDMSLGGQLSLFIKQVGFGGSSYETTTLDERHTMNKIWIIAKTTALNLTLKCGGYTSDSLDRICWFHALRLAIIRTY